MNHDCLDVELLLGRDDDALAGDERARLANHLRACDACRQGDGALRGVVALMLRPRPPLAEAARERALAAAFAAAEHAPASERTRRLPLRTALVITAAAAVALFAVLRAGPAPTPAPAASAPIAMRAPEEPVHEAPRAAEPALPLPETTAAATAPAERPWIEAHGAETHRFAHAEVTLRAGTRVRFDEGARTLELAQGEVHVEVDPRPHASFAVVTQHLRVEVLGTVFTVAPTRVTVERGRVRVLDAGGAVLASELRAGQSYPAEPHGPRAAAKREMQRDVLSEAREALAHGDVSEARALLRRFAPKKARAAEQAEAGTLQAECALLERDLPAAVRAYLEVATRFPALPAGENAAFAAAQLAARQQDPRARALFTQYLARYPQGRFAADARAALARP